MKETLKDYFLNRMFRKDLFMRGTSWLSPRPLLAKEPVENIIQALTMLAASGQVCPSASKAVNKKSAARMNQAILERSPYANEIGFMVSPLLRTGVLVPWFIQLLLNAIRQNLKADDYVWGVLEGQGQRMQKEGKTIQDPEGFAWHVESKRIPGGCRHEKTGSV